MNFGNPYNEEEFIANIESYIRATPPRCLASFKLIPSELPEKLDDNFTTAYQLVCLCGCSLGRVRGYPLSHYNSDFQGDGFITPIAFECTACSRVTEFFDTAIHGYHAELEHLEGQAGGRHNRGSGARTAFKCSTCAADVFNVFVGCVFWDFDLFFEVAEQMHEGFGSNEEIFNRAQDFFNVLVLQAVCQKCAAISFPCVVGKL